MIVEIVTVWRNAFAAAGERYYACFEVPLRFLRSLGFVCFLALPTSKRKRFYCVSLLPLHATAPVTVSFSPALFLSLRSSYASVFAPIIP